MVLLSCAKNGETVSEEVPETETVTEDVANEPETHPDANVLLDGVAVVADWDDGDTFAFIDANSGERVKARLSGFNTLESYGPVHRWGDWTGAELSNWRNRPVSEPEIVNGNANNSLAPVDMDGSASLAPISKPLSYERGWPMYSH